MKTILDITTILSQDLKSRFAVNDLFLYIKNTGSESVVIDFANVKFATRSFVDEYYNVIMKNQSSIKIETVNIHEDIQVIFDVVQRTQHKEKDIKLDATVEKCKTFLKGRTKVLPFFVFMFSGSWRILPFVLNHNKTGC